MAYTDKLISILMTFMTNSNKSLILKPYTILLYNISYYLSLQSGHNLFAGFHDGVKLPRDHYGEALVFSHGEFQVGSSLVHNVKTNFSLLSFSKLVHVLVLALFQRHMENLYLSKWKPVRPLNQYP